MQQEEAVSRCRLFAGLTPEEVKAALVYLSARRECFAPKAEVCAIGVQGRCIGLILSGKVLVERVDYWGNRNLMDALEAGQLFGEIYAGGGHQFNVRVCAAARSEVMFFDIAPLMVPQESVGPLGVRLLQNLVAVLAQKGYHLAKKMEWTFRKSTRGRLLAYLTQQARLARASAFDIPLNRQELADYLFVDRSAMSRELCAMRDAGLLRFEHNHFQLLQPVEGEEAGE